MPCNKLTLKQREFAKKVVETKNSTEAAMLAYSAKNRNVAANIASRLHRNPKVKAEIEKLLIEQNLTEDTVVCRLKEGLESTVNAISDGEVHQSNVPDMYARLGYLKEAAKIMDLYPPTRTEAKTVNIDMELDKLTPKQLEAFATSFFNSIKPKYGNQARLTDTISPSEDTEEDPSKE